MNLNSLTRRIIFHLPLWILSPFFSALWIWGGDDPHILHHLDLLPLASSWVWRMEALPGGQRSGGARLEYSGLSLRQHGPHATPLAVCWPLLQLQLQLSLSFSNTVFSPCSLGMGDGYEQ